MRFLVDTQLPPKLARHLTAKGLDTIHTTFFPEGHLLADAAIVGIAKEEARTIISKDADFLDNFLLKGAPPKVLLIDFGNSSNQDLLALFDAHLNQVLRTFEEGSQLVVFRRTEVIGY